MDQLDTPALLALAEELLEDDEDLEGGECDNFLLSSAENIVPLVLHLSTYRWKKLPRVERYEEVVDKYTADDF